MRSPSPRFTAGTAPLRRTAPTIAAIVIAAALAAGGSTAAPGADGPAVAAERGFPGGSAPALTVLQVTELGLENVQVDSASGAVRVAFENRRYRHSAECIGLLEREAGGRVIALERRLGLNVAALSVEGQADDPHFRVRFPTDVDFPSPPRGPAFERASASVDFILRPLFTYELGRITVPVQLQFQLEPFVRYNPWPGARATASLVIPVYNDFDPSTLHPDADELRPGIISLEQFAWIPRVALASATGGVFADNRYGLSLGAARPVANGALLLDSQYDVTGFLAFPAGGMTYSSMSQQSWFGGATWFAPRFDVALRLRAGQFVYGDRGTYFEFRRAFGDFDFSLFGARAGGLTVKGVRVSLPVPPMKRSTRHPLRLQPIERFPITHRTDATPVGVFVGAVASREDFLRQLSGPVLDANAYRYRRGLGRERGQEAPGRPIQWVNASGLTGFIFTPWAGALPEGTISLDYTHVPAKWAYRGRGQYVNQAYSVALGLLPRTEISLRFTRIPGEQGFMHDPDNQLTTNTDHMASGRLVLLTPRPGRPGVAVGIDDVEGGLKGTHLFHATYAVVGVPLEISCVQTRFSLGYAPRVFTAARHVLDGGFGALEVSPWRVVAARIEYDSEKWNVGIGVALPFGLKLRAAGLNLETLSAGAGWTHEL